MNETAAAEPVFPPTEDDEVWCALRGQLVTVNVCATDACVAPEMRPFCGLAQADAFFARDISGDEQC